MRNLEEAEYVCPECGEKYSRKKWLEETAEAGGYGCKITYLVAPEHSYGQDAAFVCPGCGRHIVGRQLEKVAVK